MCMAHNVLTVQSIFAPNLSSSAAPLTLLKTRFQWSSCILLGYFPFLSPHKVASFNIFHVFCCNRNPAEHSHTSLSVSAHPVHTSAGHPQAKEWFVAVRIFSRARTFFSHACSAAERCGGAVSSARQLLSGGWGEPRVFYHVDGFWCGLNAK